MMSGRALGHTGGTLDKLESIPGFTTALSPERFRDIVSEAGYAMTGQSEDIVPADRKLYSLRDVTGTVESVPLITASILSKKFAEGAQKLVFDVKCGSGAFMKELESARRLAHSLVETGRGLDRAVYAVITRMEEPLGIMVGNFLEVEESVTLLKGKPEDPRLLGLWEVIMRLVAWMLVAAGKYDNVEEAFEAAPGPIESGEALRRFEKNVELQNGDVEELHKRLGSWRAPESRDISAEQDGVVTAMDAYLTGMAGVYLGVGRSTAEDDVLPDVGIELFKKVGSEVSKGEALCRIYGHEEEALDEAESRLRKAYSLSKSGAAEAEKSPANGSMILDEIAS
jgi:pyrimidine-nucleoside phosphorylase